MAELITESQPAPASADVAARAGVGRSENPKSRDAGIEAARMALEDAGVTECDVALIFCTGKHDPHAFHEGVRSVIPAPARIAGGYTAGVITNDFLAYEGYQAGVAVLCSPRLRVDIFAEPGLNRDERAAGVRLGEQIRAAQFGGEPNLLLLYDAIAAVGDSLNLNLATPLIDGMREALDAWPPTAGVGMMGDVIGNATYQFVDDGVHQQLAMAVALHGGLRMDTIIMHGCKPAGAYRTITKAEHNIIYEIDGQPALDAVRAMTGSTDSADWEGYPFFLTFGVNRGDKFGEYREEHYANRVCMSVDPERKTLHMFEPDLRAGDEVQLMRRSIDVAYVGERTRELLRSLDGRRPFFALYIDCSIRAAAYCGMEDEDGAEVQREIGDIPLLGMYSGVEIARVAGEVRALDWTGVLCVFSEPEGAS